ncbi:MAG: hypothetical protein F6K31_08285 [Symploca sp. SIO2G7]|nr:hypothetical protein [Symploca sp. SIO2G7]
MPLKFLFKSVKTGINYVSKHPSVIFFNGVIILLFLLLTVYVKLGGESGHRSQLIVQLFAEPFTSQRPLQSYLTNLSEILWCFSLAICSFSIGLISHIRPKRPFNRFILCSALILAILLIDDIFRITLIANSFLGIPKLFTSLVYGTAIIVYSLFFRRKIASTPYLLLLIAFGLFVISSLVSSLPLPGQGTPTMLEDGTKLLALVNLAYYFWYVCQNEVLSAKTRSW